MTQPATGHRPSHCHGTPREPHDTNSLFEQGGTWRCYSSLKASEMSTNVTSVEADRRINPGQPGSLDRVDSNFAGQAVVPTRRLTRLDADYYAAVDRAHTVSVPAPRAPHSTVPAPRTSRENSRENLPAQRKPVRDHAFLRLLERVVGGWAPTLHGSLVLVALYLVASVLMVIALGAGGLLLACGIALLLTWLNAAGRLPRS